ncbi:MAG: succinate dehydrogenase assembly factor 2 [Burkholderiaceae bacterium]
MSDHSAHQSDPARRRRLRWRARRGLLENDLVLTRFFERYEASLSDDDVDALTRLFDLPDNDLLNLIMGRQQPEDELDRASVHAIIEKLRTV